MVAYYRNVGDQETTRYWADILRDLDLLGIQGMSDDEETVNDEGNQVMITYSPAFRHPGLDASFDKVDRTPSSEPSIFTNVGRHRVPRIRSDQTVERDPPQGLPDWYLRNGHIDGSLRF